MGQAQGPVSPDVSTYYQAGVAAGAGGTPGIDLSQGFPSSDAQAAFNQGFLTGSSPVTLAQVLGAPLSTGAVAPSAAAPTTVTFQQFLQQYQTPLLIGGFALFAFMLLSQGGGGRRR
jgi:hypothetical protein